MKSKLTSITLVILFFIGCSHNIVMKEIPSDSRSFQVSSIPENQKLPLIMNYYRLISDGADTPMNQDHVEQALNNLRRSGIFSEVVKNKSTQNYDKYLLVDLTSKENWDKHKVSNGIKTFFVVLSSYILAPFFKTTLDYEDEYIFVFKRWDGETRQYTAKSSARLKMGYFADGGDAGKDLGSKVRTKIFNSVINQMQNDLVFFSNK